MRNTRKGFTLIELMIVIAIIAIIAAIAIPGILSARRSANAGSALANLKSFSTAMSTYSQDQSDQHYPISTTTDFSTYYSHIATKGGYNYKYAADGPDGNAGTVSNPANQFAYVATPVSANNGTRAYYVDESNRIYECTISGDVTTVEIDPSSTTVTQTATATGKVKLSVTGTTTDWAIKS